MSKNNKTEPQKISSVSEIENVETYFLDMFGLLWDGNKFYDGTLDFLKSLKESGKKIILLSNATVLREPFIQSQAKKGLIAGCHYDDVITSGEAFCHVLNQGFFEKITGKKEYKYFVLGTENKLMFEKVSEHQTDIIDQADCVYLSGFGAVVPEEGERIFKEYVALLNPIIQKKIPIVCANPDLTFMSHGKQVLVQGSLGRYAEEMGADIHWFGKPYKYIFDYALEKTKAQKETSIMVGDTVETDVLGGSQAGLKTLLVTKTGITGDILSQGGSLDMLYQKNNVQPTYITDQFSCLSLNFKIRRNHVRASSLASKKILCL